MGKKTKAGREPKLFKPLKAVLLADTTSSCLRACAEPSSLGLNVSWVSVHFTYSRGTTLFIMCKDDRPHLNEYLSWRPMYSPLLLLLALLDKVVASCSWEWKEASEWTTCIKWNVLSVGYEILLSNGCLSNGCCSTCFWMAQIRVPNTYSSRSFNVAFSSRFGFPRASRRSSMLSKCVFHTATSVDFQSSSSAAKFNMVINTGSIPPEVHNPSIRLAVQFCWQGLLVWNRDLGFSNPNLRSNAQITYVTCDS